jgi:dTDP-4-amino-4,6-dideoxygalactose transaminase
MIYYPVPAHKQKMFASFDVADMELPVTDWLTPRVISLPIHTEMTEEELQYIATNFLEVVASLKK